MLMTIAMHIAQHCTTGHVEYINFQNTPSGGPPPHPPPWIVFKYHRVWKERDKRVNLPTTKNKNDGYCSQNSLQQCIWFLQKGEKEEGQRGFRIYIANNGQKLMVGLSPSRPLLTQFFKYLVVFLRKSINFILFGQRIFGEFDKWPFQPKVMW